MATTTATTTTTTTERLYSPPSRSQLARQAAYQLLSPQQQQQQQQQHQPSRSFDISRKPSKNDQHYPTTTHSYLTSPTTLPFLPLLASVWFLANTSGPTLWFAALVDFARVTIVTGVVCGLDWYARGMLSESAEKGGDSGRGEEKYGGPGRGARSESVVRTFVLVGFVVVLGEVMSLGGGGG